MRFGPFVRTKRLERGITLRDFARRLSVTAEDFNPLQDRKSAPIRTGVGILKQIFIDNRQRDSAK